MKSSRISAAVLATALAVTGCAGGEPEGSGGQARPDRGDRPRSGEGRGRRVQRPCRRVREGASGRGRAAPGVQVGRDDVHRPARGRHAARRVHRAVHRRPRAHRTQADRGHQRRGREAAVRQGVQRVGGEGGPGGRRRHAGRADRRVWPGPALQPHAVHAGGARPGQAADHVGGGALGREADRRAHRPGRLRPDDGGQHRRLDPRHARLRVRRPGRAALG